MPDHHYRLTVKWTGNTGSGTFNPGTYKRDHKILVDNKSPINGSSDPKFRGDKTKHNPEELLVASIATCHMLWYLDLCTRENVIVVDYIDQATGVMYENGDKGGAFKEVILSPVVIVVDKRMIERALMLHKKANELCYIANSVNFEIHHDPVCKVADK